MESEDIKTYIEAVFQFFQVVNKKSTDTNNGKQKMISLIIYNYVKMMAKRHNIDLRQIQCNEHTVNITPIFNYIKDNGISLYDFNNITFDDVDVNNEKDLERFVLTHMYYIYKTNN